MASLKIFGPGGIDEKSNDLLRNPKNLRSALNICLNDREEYVKRPGTEVATSSILTTTNNEDAIYIASMDTYFYFDGTNYIDTKRGIVPSFNTTRPHTTKKLCATEVLGTLIFTHPDDPKSVMKYDGQAVYFAGLPTPDYLSFSSPGGTPFVLFYYSFVDAVGNEINGPSLIIQEVDTISVSQALTLYKEVLSGFKTSFIRNGSIQITIEETGRTHTFDDCSIDVQNLSVGDKIPVRASFIQASSGGSEGGVSINPDPASTNLALNNLNVLLMLEIESITLGTPSGGQQPVTITFTQESIEGYKVIVDPNANLHGGLVLKQWLSQSEFTGYSATSFFSRTAVYNNLRNLPLWEVNTFSVKYCGFGDLSLSAEYDITTSKLRPPNCKFVMSYGYQLICGNVLGFWDFNNIINLYPNDDLIMYSDLSNGDMPESFTETNRQLIGETHDGFVAGLGRIENSLIVFKNRGLFALDGVLLPGQYAIRKIPSERVGLSAFKSIVETEQGIMFQGARGIYATNGSEVVKISDPLQESLKQVDPSQTRAVTDSKNRRHLLYMRSSELVEGAYEHFIFVFDYDYNQLFWWKGIDGSKGLTIDNNENVTFFGESDVNRFLIDQKRDKHPSDPLLDSPIESHVKTHWFDLGEPSLLKKAIGFRLFCLGNSGQTMKGKILIDWGRLEKSEFDINDFSDPLVKTKNRKIDVQQAQSISIELSNNVIDEDMNISGYEFEIGVIQNGDRNVK